jgi:serine/threonine-protein kinase HSL1 (negative regulator of Swe1 kinase)
MTGRVRIARHAKSGQYAAIKIISKYPTGSQLIYERGRLQHSVEREIVIMKLIDHPNIMRLYDVWETSTDLYLIMEYVEGGELFDYLCSHGRLPTSEALRYFQQIISAVHYCHSFNIAHRDLKPENLLLDVNKNIKLADFGLAAYGANDGLLETFCGSPHYAAPEVISGQVYNGSCSDTWSCGVILHALLTGRLPFHEEDGDTLRSKIILAEFTMPADIDPLAQDLLSRMLEKDVTKRIPISDVIKHPFYASQAWEGQKHTIPDLEDIAKPIRSISSIDSSIFANLRTLWADSSNEELIEFLRNDDANWQKAIYHLLLGYRSRYLENYEEEEEVLKRHASRRAKKRDASSQRSPEATSAASDLATTRWSLPPRAAPPTPRRARRQSGVVSSMSGEDSDGDLVNRCGNAGAPRITFSSPSPSHSPPSPPSPLSPEGAAWDLPPLDVPELQDEKIQSFFRQIVDHLNVMQHRASTSPNPSLPMGSVDLNVPSQFRANATAAPPPSPVGKDDDQIDESESGILVARVSGGLTPTDSYGLGISNHEKKAFGFIRQKRPTVQIPVSRVSEKENEDEGYLIIDKVDRRSSPKMRDEISGNRKVRIVEPDTGRGKLQKSVAPPSPAFSNAGSSFVLLSPNSPKRTWFDSVFRFKPLAYDLFSVDDAQTSRSECRRILMELGAQAMLMDAEGSGVLKCKLDELRDPAGVMAVLKAVRFRVEVRHAEKETGYTTVLRFVQEKGAMSSFKAVFSRVQRDWELGE